ncbi:MAG: energy-coupling factor ABC transporter ATP-binding protein, partial [Rudaea sp.]
MLDRVTYTYPGSARPALSDISLEIVDGSFVGVVGASGAGKSTLCAALAGFIPHHFRGDLKGRVQIGDMETVSTPLTSLVTQVGLVFQNPFNQLTGARLTVAEEVAFGLENIGMPRQEMQARVEDVLTRVGLARLAARSPYALSGGEMQRVALASILVMDPRVLVLDEPTAQLDPIGARQVFEVIHEIVSSRRCTVVMVEQKTEWLAAFADRLVALRDGRVVRDGTPRTVLADPDLQMDLVVPRYVPAARAA